VIDIRRIRENPEKIKKALDKRLFNVDFTEFLHWDSRRKQLQHETDELRARKNEASKKIPAMKKAGEDVSLILQEMKQISTQIKHFENEFSQVNSDIQDFLAALPNVPDDDVPAGGKENNVSIHEWGEKPVYDFTPLDHIELVTRLGLIDYTRGAKIGGNGFWLYSGVGARLEWALLNYFVESHFADGYEFILPPHILTWNCGFTAGQFPKFREDVFEIRTGSEGSEKDAGQFLLPTSETALVNFYRDEIVDENELPRKMFSYSPCYRKEAGSYRTNERGMIRGHQFNKIEIFQFTKPEDSDNALKEMIEKAERLVQGLGLHYRVSKLAAADCSASMAKTFDIEVWIPSMEEYKEVSSASNARDYQARRGNMRFRRKSTGKTEFMNTLNASALATSRLVPAMVEQFQENDGAVRVPECLQKWVGVDSIKPNG
jgi:seryl-tRNA synthetase